MPQRFFILFLLPLFVSAQAQQIRVLETQVLQLNGKVKQTGLFDEFDLLSIEKGKVIMEAQKPFHPTYNKLYQPQDFLIRLEAFYRIDSLFYFDGAGKDSLLIYSGVPGDWKLEIGLYTNRYKTWRKEVRKIKTSYLLLRFLGPQAEIGELLLFGQKTKNKDAPLRQQRKLRSTPSLGSFMGINAFVDDPIKKLSAIAGMVREYHNWDWHYPNDLQAGGVALEGIRFAPASAGPWDFDRYYEDL